MNYKNLFPSAYFKASDVDTPVLVTITKIDPARKMSSGEEKPVLAFLECEQELVLNKTNGNALAEIYGEDVENWFNKKIVLFKDKTTMQGKPTDCIRIRAPKAAKPTVPPPPVLTVPAATVADDDVPF